MKMLLFTPVELPTHLGKCLIQLILIQQVDSLRAFYINLRFNRLFELLNICYNLTGYSNHTTITPKERQNMKMAEVPPRNVDPFTLVGTLYWHLSFLLQVHLDDNHQFNASFWQPSVEWHFLFLGPVVQN